MGWGNSSRDKFAWAHFEKAPSTELPASLMRVNKGDVAIRSFFRYATLEAPDHSAQIQRILAIPDKRHERTSVEFLTQSEIAALLAAPNKRSWSGLRATPDSCAHRRQAYDLEPPLACVLVDTMPSCGRSLRPGYFGEEAAHPAIACIPSRDRGRCATRTMRC